MSSKDRILKQIERNSSDSLSFQSAEKISGSSAAMGRIIDDSDDLIKGLKRQNGTVNNVENRSSEYVLRTINPPNIGSAASVEDEFDIDKESSKSKDTPEIADKVNSLDATDDLLKTLSNAKYSSEDDMAGLVTTHTASSPNLSQDSLDILHETESSVLKVTDPSIHSMFSDADSDEILSLYRMEPHKSSQQASNFLSHSRNLSQTTSQLTNLKETVSIADLTAGCSKRPHSPESGRQRTHDEHSKDYPESSVTTVFSQDEYNQESPSEVGLQVTTFSDTPYPDWKLDRRESGHLYWRRDSSTLNGVDPSSRVKFRYDIEVCEFETRSSDAEDLPEEDEDEVCTEEESEDEEFPELARKQALTDLRKELEQTDEGPQLLGSRVVVCVVAITAVILTALYRWLISSPSVVQ